MAEEIAVPGGGRYKPNRKTYRQILVSGEIGEACMRAARSEGGKGRTMRQFVANGRQKARVYAKDRKTLGSAHPHL